MQTAIIGGGNFGPAIANIIAANGHPTYLWMRDAQQAEEVERLRENRRGLPGHTFAQVSSRPRTLRQLPPARTSCLSRCHPRVSRGLSADCALCAS